MFQAEFHPAQDMPRQMRLFVEDNEEIGSQKDADYIEKRCQTVFRELPGIDRLIDENTAGWNTRRMGKVELAVLRLAGYDYAISIEHEDSLMSGREGLLKAIQCLKNVLIYEDRGEMLWA